MPSLPREADSDAAPLPAPRAAGRPRVLLLDDEWPATAYIAAGLAAAGWEVHAYTTYSADTRFAGGFLTRTRAPDVRSAEYLPALEALLRAQAFDRVLPLTEPILFRLWDAAPSCEPLVYPPTAPWQRDLVRSKRRQLEAADDAGVPVAAFRRAGDEDAVERAVAELGLPVVVKGTSGAGGAGVHIVRSVADALGRWRDHDGPERPYLQQYVHGPTYLVGGLFHDGEPLRLYAAEKTRMWPSATGPSVELRTIADDALTEPALAVFRTLRWSGLASADFVGDGRGGYYFLEVNPRPWGSIGAVRTAGVDLFTPMAELLRGRIPRADLRYRAGVTATVFPQFLHMLGDRGGPAALARLASAWRAWRDAPWQRPQLALHLARAPLRAWYGATRGRRRRADDAS